MGKLIQRVDDAIEQNAEWQKEHDRKSDEWRKSIDERFAPIEDFVREFGSVKKTVFGTLAALGTLATVGIAVYRFLKEHWRG